MPRKRAFQKLYKNGSSTVVTIPRWLLYDTGFLAGQMLIIELLEDNSLLLRQPDADDFVAKRSVAVMAKDQPAGFR